MNYDIADLQDDLQQLFRLARQKVEGDENVTVTFNTTGDPDSYYEAFIAVNVGTESRTFYIRENVYGDLEDRSVLGDSMTPDTMRKLIALARKWIERMPGVHERKAAELIRTLEKAKALSDELNIQNDALGLIIRAATEIMGDLITDQR
jgi:hypothetical protein